MDDFLKNILTLSKRISCHSPPIKPFLRFSDQTRDFWRKCNNKSLYWDFDYTLQKILFNMICESGITSEELSIACVEQWKDNLERLYINKKHYLERLKRKKLKLTFHHHEKTRLILKMLKSGSRLLYIGCGAGQECLAYANEGIDVVGIDTDPKLVSISNEMADYFKLPFRAICMDAMSIELEPKSFDCVFLEFYGQQPSKKDVLALQENLAKVLKDDGKGFISADRKKYSSFWFLMGSAYPNSMTAWLAGQATLDCLFSTKDTVEESLKYGLYSKHHTATSLSQELKTNFDVLDCWCLSDSRYIMSMVTPPKNPQKCSEGIFTEFALEEKKLGKLNISDAWGAIEKINMICSLLDSHEKDVVAFFSDSKNINKNPLSAIKTNLSPFISLLAEVMNTKTLHI